MSTRGRSSIQHLLLHSTNMSIRPWQMHLRETIHLINLRSNSSPDSTRFSLREHILNHRIPLRRRRRPSRKIPWPSQKNFCKKIPSATLPSSSPFTSGVTQVAGRLSSWTNFSIVWAAISARESFTTMNSCWRCTRRSIC